MPKKNLIKFCLPKQSGLTKKKSISNQFRSKWHGFSLFLIPFQRRLLIQPSGSIVYAAVRCSWKTEALRYRLGKTPNKQKRAFFFLILNISFRKGHPYPLNYKLARNGWKAVVACFAAFFLQALFRLSSLPPFWWIRSFLRASAWFAPFVLHFFVILRFGLRFSDSRDPTLISDLFI